MLFIKFKCFVFFRKHVLVLLRTVAEEEPVKKANVPALRAFSVVFVKNILMYKK